MESRDLRLHGDLNLIVTGYVEPNRPRISRQLAQRLGLTLVDVEREVEERLGDTIANLRATYGERHLKTVETEVMDEAVLHRRGLIRRRRKHAGEQRSSPRVSAQRRHHLLGRVAGFDLAAHSSDAGRALLRPGRGSARYWRIAPGNGASARLKNVVEFDATYVSEPVLIERIAEYWRELAIDAADLAHARMTHPANRA